MRRNDDLRRRRPRRNALPRVLIVCEGVRTEPAYFRSLRHSERIPIDIEFITGATPKTLVDAAVQKKKEATRLAKTSRDPNNNFEQVWCVFDVDEHPYLAEAKQQAAANGINVAVSNPCFELWILLHFREQTAHIHRHKVQSECRKHLPGYEKQVQWEDLRDRYAAALERARNLHKWHESRQTSEANPYTGVFLLVEELKRPRS